MLRLKNKWDLWRRGEGFDSRRLKLQTNYTLIYSNIIGLSHKIHAFWNLST